MASPGGKTQRLPGVHPPVRRSGIDGGTAESRPRVGTNAPRCVVRRWCSRPCALRRVETSGGSALRDGSPRASQESPPASGGPGATDGPPYSWSTTQLRVGLAWFPSGASRLVLAAVPAAAEQARTSPRSSAEMLPPGRLAPLGRVEFVDSCLRAAQPPCSLPWWASSSAARRVAAAGRSSTWTAPRPATASHDA